MMKSKIVILANDSGGLYLFRKELIEKLVEDYHVIAVIPDTGFMREIEAIGCEVIALHIERRGMNPIRDFGLLISYFKYLTIQKPELVITYTIKPNVYGGFVCRLCKTPYIANITGLGTAFQEDSVLRKLVTMLYKVGLKKAKTVFFENEENCCTFLDEKIVRREQTCVLNGAGVNIEYFQFEEYPSDESVVRFLFVGRVMKEKGIDELISAMQKLREDNIDCLLDIVGGYEEDYSLKMKQYEKEGWLCYHGYQKDVRPFIKRCHCFVLPSWHEGMANTNLECASSGRPVITSNIHGCLEAVEDGVSGYLCECRNSQDLYQKMKTFVGLSYAERKQMGLAGRKRMEMYFDKRQVVAKTLSELYK